MRRVLRRQAEDGDKKAALLLKITEQPTGFLSTIQIGITLAGFLGAAFGADNLAGRLSQWLMHRVPPDRRRGGRGAHPVRGLITLITLLFYPDLRRAGAQAGGHEEKRGRGPLHLPGGGLPGRACMRPVIWLLTVSTNGVLRLLHIDPNEEDDEVSEEGIRMMVDIGEEKGAIEAGEKEMIENIFEFDNMTAEDVMVHRTDMVMLWVDDTAEEIEADHRVLRPVPVPGVRGGRRRRHRHAEHPGVAASTPARTGAQAGAGAAPAGLLRARVGARRQALPGYAEPEGPPGHRH